MKKIICLFAFVTVLVTCSCSNNYYYNESQVPNNVVASENEIETVKQLQNDSITVVNDSLFAYAGALHNDILESILPQNNANINSIILPPIIDPINISPTINNYGCALLSDQETIDSLIMITDDMSYLYDYDIDEQLDYNEDKGDISSNTKTVLSLFFDAYFGYANSLNDVNNIVSYYHDIVSSSNELTQTEKICILMCIEITKYSYSFWQDYGLQ